VMGAAPERMLGAVRTVNMDAPPACSIMVRCCTAASSGPRSASNPYTRLGGVQAVGDEHDPATHLLELIQDQADMAHALPAEPIELGDVQRLNLAREKSRESVVKPRRGRSLRAETSNSWNSNSGRMRSPLRSAA
jgi:hypothetical protein